VIRDSLSLLVLVVIGCAAVLIALAATYAAILLFAAIIQVTA
jgi:hypothetical protein